MLTFYKISPLQLICFTWEVNSSGNVIAVDNVLYSIRTYHLGTALNRLSEAILSSSHNIYLGNFEGLFLNFLCYK